MLYSNNPALYGAKNNSIKIMLVVSYMCLSGSTGTSRESAVTTTDCSVTERTGWPPESCVDTVRVGVSMVTASGERDIRDKPLLTLIFCWDCTQSGEFCQRIIYKLCTHRHTVHVGTELHAI